MPDRNISEHPQIHKRQLKGRDSTDSPRRSPWARKLRSGSPADYLEELEWKKKEQNKKSPGELLKY